MARTTQRGVTFARNLDSILGSNTASSPLAIRQAEVEARRAETYKGLAGLDRETIESIVIGLKRRVSDTSMKPDNAETQSAYLAKVADLTAKGKEVPEYDQFRVNWQSPVAYALVQDNQVALADYEHQVALENLEAFLKVVAAIAAKTKK